MSVIKSIKRLMKSVSCLPVHPQWLIYRHERAGVVDIVDKAHGRVLDIGCGEMDIRGRLSGQAHYIGLDYLRTARQLYASVPDIYANGSSLPVRDNTIDTVLLLDVMEHMQEPDTAIREISRVLKPQGHLIIQVPFIYPIHDAPHDYQRWTIHGLNMQCNGAGLITESQAGYGHPVETSILLLNIALIRSVIECARTKNPGVLFAPIVVVLIPILNLIAWAMAMLLPDDEFMRMGYRLFLRKTA